MKKYYVLILTLFTTLTARTQDFLIKNNGDTLHGKINISGNMFLISGDSGNNTLHLADDVNYLNSRNLKGTVFHSKLYIYSDNIYDVQKWNYNGGELRDTVMILKEVISSPKMKLFEAVDKNKVLYYFIKKTADKIPVQMIVDYYIPGRDNKEKSLYYQDRVVSTIVQRKTYIDQLRFLMSDCKKITDDDFAMMDYRFYSFKKIIRLYNRCK